MRIKRNKAFTLVELLVVLAVIALLMGVLMPALNMARQKGYGVVCLSNLRQMVMAANSYTVGYEGRYPLASFVEDRGVLYLEYGWDFTKTFESGSLKECQPGALWVQSSNSQIQQCPVFKGAANSPGDPYTGYNYNASYIGGIMKRHSSGELKGQNSTKVYEVLRPADCAVFGDGQYAAGANKFMRSPFTGKLDEDYPELRPYGTQGYRHSKRTNVAYCDGSANTVKERYVDTYPPLKSYIAEGTGFLSEDNSTYDLE